MLLGLSALPVAAYLGLCGLMAAAEPWLVYPAPAVEEAVLEADAARLGATVLPLEAADGTHLVAWRFGPDSQPLVLHFSGNGSRVGGNGSRYQAFEDLGYSVLHLAYRGYPGSEGAPDEAGLLQDALAAWDLARRSHAAEDIVLNGHSLGGGVAVALAGALDARGERPRALVTEATFSQAWAVGAEQYPWLPVRWLMRNRWESVETGASVHVPTLILHGSADTYIPPAHGEALAAAIPGARYQPVPGRGHNDRLFDADDAARDAFIAVAGPAGALRHGP